MECLAVCRRPPLTLRHGSAETNLREVSKKPFGVSSATVVDSSAVYENVDFLDLKVLLCLISSD